MIKVLEFIKQHQQNKFNSKINNIAGGGNAPSKHLKRRT